MGKDQHDKSCRMDADISLVGSLAASKSARMRMVVVQ